MHLGISERFITNSYLITMDYDDIINDVLEIGKYETFENNKIIFFCAIKTNYDLLLTDSEFNDSGSELWIFAVI